MNKQQKAIVDEMKAYGASEKVAKYIAAQSSLETGYFKSDIYKENNNLFGMKLPHTRITTAVSENRGHAVYKCTYDSIIDYIIWLTYNGFVQRTMQSIDLFILRLENSGFNPNKNYSNKIYELYKNL